MGKGIALRTSCAFGPMQVAVSSPAPAPSENGINWVSNGGPGIPLIRTHNSSVAGGDVILVGLAIVSVAAIFCYIRITRRSRESRAWDDIILVFQLPFYIFKFDRLSYFEIFELYAELIEFHELHLNCRALYLKSVEKWKHLCDLYKANKVDS